MNDRQLRTFICAAEQKSFSKAAAMSYVSSAALNSQINTLEKSIGIKLFNRSTHGVELTPEGELFLTTARQLLKIDEDLRKQCRILEAGETVTVSLQSMNVAKFRGFVLEYQVNHPECTYCMINLEDYMILDALKDDSIQIVYGPEFKDYDTDTFEFLEEKEDIFWLTIRRDHPLAGKKIITMEDLGPYKLNACDCPAWKCNPAELLRRNGIKTDIVPQDHISDENFSNKLLRNEILMAAVMPIPSPTGLYVNIPTDISAGKFGILIRKDAGEAVKEIVEEYRKL